jgi:S-adenosylmethionine:tRNA ribosyltransferase-isomerase
MQTIKNLEIADYTYDLPNHKIAFEPLVPKDSSKLLVYQNNTISDSHFTNIADYLPENSLLVFNNSKVIPARLQFYTATNACIEIFLLEPILPNNYELAFGNLPSKSAIWKCFVGNVKKWKTECISQYIDTLHGNFEATIVEKTEDAYLIKLNWDIDASFSEIIECMGKIPLPPYIKRETIESDKITYQTVYAKINGSVAAPTAGLHFTNNTFASIAAKNIGLAEVTLHVGAGTFKPVKASKIGDHTMHSEYFVIGVSVLEKLLAASTITAVGTTSCRTLESIYWLGIKLLKKTSNTAVMSIHQWEVYELDNADNNFSKQKAIQAVIDYCHLHQLQSLECNTQILIVPGYRFKMVDNLITNFHQPNSTLLLLIAAFISTNDINKIKDWKTIYNHALQNDYRFLSYGDSSILMQ